MISTMHCATIRLTNDHISQIIPVGIHVGDAKQSLTCGDRLTACYRSVRAMC